MTEHAIFAGLDADLLLDNDRVFVQRHVVPPGGNLGVHDCSQPHLVIYVRGGQVVDSTSRVVIWRDGSARWYDAAVGAEDGGVNVSDTDIELVTVVLKAVDAAVPRPIHPVRPLSYPNVPGEDLLDNELVIVQRFVMNPGQWEGVHAHQPNMLYVHIRGGQWASRTFNEPAAAYPDPSADGSVGWIEPVELDVGHESGNVGATPIDFLWVSLKR